MSLRLQSECQHVIVSALGAANATIIAAPTAGSVQSGQRVGIFRAIINNTGAAATTVTFQDSDGTAISAGFAIAANGLLVIETPINQEPWFITLIGKGARLNSSAAGPVNADIYFQQGV